MKASRRSLKYQFLFLVGLLVVVAIAAMFTLGKSVSVRQTVIEASSVADMVENVGTWASQYRSLWVKSAPDGSIKPGTYLERNAYGTPETPPLRGIHLDMAAMEQIDPPGVDAYYSKNPVLVQRELSDVTSVSRSRAKFRITARTVLNPANTPTDFELRALDAADQRGLTEYFEVSRGRLLYARTLVAAKSCLKCHGSSATAPSYIREKFTGGGGYGYAEGMPAGLISVSIPMQSPARAIGSSLTPGGWIALGAFIGSIVLILVFVWRRFVSPPDHASLADAA